MLNVEREFVRDAFERHMRDPSRYSRPMCIIRLKQWRVRQGGTTRHFNVPDQSIQKLLSAWFKENQL